MHIIGNSFPWRLRFVIPSHLPCAGADREPDRTAMPERFLPRPTDHPCGVSCGWCRGRPLEGACALAGRMMVNAASFLKEGEHGSLRIGDNRHPTDILKSSWGHQEIGAELLALSGYPVAVGGPDVCQPVGGNIRIAMSCRRNAADKMLSILNMQVAGGVGLSFSGSQIPPKEARIELAGELRVWRTQIRPAECAVHTRNSRT